MAEENKAQSPEEKATSHGWVPQDKWVEAGNDSADWVDAREFNVRGELMGRITSQSKELRAVQEAQAQRDAKLDALTKNLNLLREQNKQLALKRIKEERSDLKRMRLDAEKEEDLDTVASIDEDLESLEATETEINKAEEAVAAESTQGLTPQQTIEFQEWVEENPWYVTDQAARNYADFVGATTDREGKSFQEYLKEVRDKVVPLFEKTYNDSGSSRRTVLEQGANGGSKGGKNTSYAATLTETEREMGKSFIEDGLFTSLEQYAEELQKAN